MKFRVLGCSGGIGEGRHTTSFLVNDKVLIDAGTGLNRLTLDEMRRIDTLFLTHAHLDHILCLPTMLDSVGTDRGYPLKVYATADVLQTLDKHIFNWEIWPDFTLIPSREDAFLSYAEISVGQRIEIDDLSITAIPANHGRPAVGYLLRDAGGSLLFSGDTSSHLALWELANNTPDLRHFIVETSFPDALKSVAIASNHYCPETLLPDLLTCRTRAKVWITHLKPGNEAQIMAQIRAADLPCQPQALVPDQLLET